MVNYGECWVSQRYPLKKKDSQFQWPKNYFLPASCDRTLLDVPLLIKTSFRSKTAGLLVGFWNPWCKNICHLYMSRIFDYALLWQCFCNVAKCCPLSELVQWSNVFENPSALFENINVPLTMWYPVFFQISTIERRRKKKD